MLFQRKKLGGARTLDKSGGIAAQAAGGEIAGFGADLYGPALNFAGVLPNIEPVLSGRTPGADYAYPYGLLEEALDKDAHLSALVSQRKAAVFAWQGELAPSDNSTLAAEVCAFVETALEGIGGATGRGSFEHDLWELLDAIPYGFAVSEIIWEAASVHGRAGLFPVRLLARHPRRFAFSEHGELRLLTREHPNGGEALPPRKFLVFAPYGRHENPYGLPLLRSVWWLAWFKRQVLKYWVMYCEKFGTPTTVLKHPLGATDREKAAYRRIIGSIQQETGLVVPEGVEFELLEAQRGGSAGAYRQLIEFCNAEMSKALVGQTLTSEQGNRGARSLGDVHYRVREDIVRQDASALESLVNSQLIRWIVDLNFEAGRRLYPQWKLNKPQEDDLALQLDIDEFFAAQQLPLDVAELYARYGRSRPQAAASTEVK